MLAAWFLNIFGITKTTLIYVESIAIIKTLSITGKILRPFVSDMYSFWQEMCDKFQLEPVAAISMERDSSIYHNKMIENSKRALGTTDFDDLISVVFSHEFQSTLIHLGFSSIIVQVGTRSQYAKNVPFTISPQLKYEIVSVVSNERFRLLLENSDLIVSHGGSGTLIQGLELHKSIIAVANPNTVGNHQEELVNYLTKNGYIHSCNVSGLNNCLHKACHSKPLNYKLNIHHLNKVFELKTLLLSFREFLEMQSVDQIYIIVPECEVFDFLTLVTSLAWSNCQITVMSETDLLPDQVLSLCDKLLKSRSGWFKQQLLKLKAADIVKTDFYLILDSDCILRCPLNFTDLISTNKTSHKRSYLQTEEIFKHPRWYRGSSKLLGITDPFLEDLKGFGIGVTPQILSVDIVKKMTTFLQNAHQIPWTILLANNRFQMLPPANWTEYTLYYLFAERTGLLTKYHVLGTNNIANYYQSAWTNEHVSNWNPTGSVAPFVIFQSNLGLGGKIPSTFLESVVLSNKPKNRRRKIYFICSELEFHPVVGGINTFIRVIISTFKESISFDEQNVELIFCGLKCGDSLKDCPLIPGISFKFFHTSGSKQAPDLSTYFKSFSKFSTLMSDLQEFGEQCTNWILSDCQSGDVCVTTIVYELNLQMVKNLIDNGVKIVHTVHSLVAKKAMATLRVFPMDKINYLDKIRVTVLGYVFWNEKIMMQVCNIKCLSWAVPKILRESLTLEHFLIENSKAVLVPSRQLTFLAASLYEHAKDRIHYVPWGLPVGQVLGEYFENKLSTRNTSSNEIRCLALCKLIPQKGLDVLIDALRKIEEIDTSLSQRIKLKICGDMSYMNESTYFLNLKNRCDSLQAIKVEFTGWLEGQAKWNVMNQSDLLLVSSLTEPFGFSVIEAMKLGMGIVSFETEGPLDIVKSTFRRLVPLNGDSETKATNFASAVIDICYSSRGSEGFQKIKEAARCAAREWNMQAFFETLFSLV